MSLNIALAHHWMVSMRGGERVLEQICELYPNAPIYTLFSDPENLDKSITSHPIHSSVLNRIPGARTRHQTYLPLYPLASKLLKVSPATDVLISSDASVIKGISVPVHVKHICYCHSPPRYLWDMTDVYANDMTWMKRTIFRTLVPHLRKFDQSAACNVHHFIANSRFVADRIKLFYNRVAAVIHPPASVEHFDNCRPREDFYLIVAQLVPYKRVDLAVQAFNRSGHKLVVIGEGSQFKQLRAAAGNNVQLLGKQPFSVLKDHYERCKAFVFPGIEDFGITAVEAQAAGAPVIAVRSGGSLDTVLENQTGVFFDEQNVDSLIDAINRFEQNADQYSAEACRTNAMKFTNEVFRTRFAEFISQVTSQNDQDTYSPRQNI